MGGNNNNTTGNLFFEALWFELQWILLVSWLDGAKQEFHIKMLV